MNTRKVVFVNKELNTRMAGLVLVKLFCNTLFDKYLSVASLHWC